MNSRVLKAMAIGVAVTLTLALTIVLRPAQPAYAAGTSPVSICVVDSNGNPLQPTQIKYQVGGGSILYFSGAWNGTCNTGSVSTPTVTTVTIWVYYNGTESHLTQNAASNSVFDFHTILLTLRLQTCAGVPLAGGAPRYGLGGSYSMYWFPQRPTGASGEVTAQFFPGIYSFEMQYKGTADQKLSVSLPDANTTLTWNTTLVTIAYNGAVTYGGAVGQTASFKAASPTVASMELLAGTYKFKFGSNTAGDYTFSGCSYLIDYAPPMSLVNLTGPNDGFPDGDNGWFKTSPVTGTVYGDDTAGGGSTIDTFDCSGATLANPAGLGTASIATADFSVTAEGSTHVSCTAKDHAGNTSLAASRDVKIDTVAPTIVAEATTSPDAGGSYTGDVTIHFTCSDDGSGIPVGNCPADQTLSEGGADSSTAETVTDRAGNTSGPSNVVTVSFDTTPPTIVAAATTSPNADGWYNDDVTVHFTCDDGAGSGIPEGNCPSDQTLSTEGAAGVSSIAMTVTDAAGNTSDPSNVVTVYIDKTLPGVSVTGFTSGDIFTLGNAPTPGCSTSDSGGSGVATEADVNTTGGTGNGVGTFTVTCTGALDGAGNAQSDPVSATYYVRYTTPRFFAPIDNAPTVNSGKAGKVYPVKWSLTDSSGHFISSLAAIKAITYKLVPANTFTGDPSDALETEATGGTGLRYDATTNQFVFNWATPRVAGSYMLFVTIDDGSAPMVAYFNLR